MSRSVWLKREPVPGEVSNDGTIHSSALGMHSGVAPIASFEGLFRRHYPAVRDLLNGHAVPGLGLVVVSGEGLEAAAWFAAQEAEATPLIIGRHGATEIFLPSDPRLSLRHLAVILLRHRAGEPVRFRVLDLRTPTAFADEKGRALEAIESLGPLLLQCASFAMMMFPTDESGSPWPEDADAAWKRIPERVYVDSRTANPERWLAVRERADSAAREAAPEGSRDVTLVPSFPGPVFPSRALVRSEAPRGELVVTSHSGRVSLSLGPSAARQGVLLGRYDRCDTAGLPILGSPSLSRVHLLLIELDRVLYAVDTASTNGSWVGPRRIQLVRVEPGLRLRLAQDAVVEWRPFH
jgi:hypothetical protein